MELRCSLMTKVTLVAALVFVCPTSSAGQASGRTWGSTLEGCIEIAGSRVVTGWVFDRARPGPAALRLEVDGEPSGPVLRQWRPDLAHLLLPGKHGFTVATLPPFDDRTRHVELFGRSERGPWISLDKRSIRPGREKPLGGITLNALEPDLTTESNATVVANLDLWAFDPGRETFDADETTPEGGVPAGLVSCRLSFGGVEVWRDALPNSSAAACGRGALHPLVAGAGRITVRLPGRSGLLKLYLSPRAGSDPVPVAALRVPSITD